MALESQGRQESTFLQYGGILIFGNIGRGFFNQGKQSELMPDKHK